MAAAGANPSTDVRICQKIYIKMVVMKSSNSVDKTHHGRRTNERARVMWLVQNINVHEWMLLNTRMDEAGRAWTEE